MKVLSIAMPIYNVQDFLRETLESFVAEKEAFSPYEVLMVDDGSTDGSPDICKEYAQEYPEMFLYLPKTNGHYGSAVNYAIDHAGGSYFRIVDGDDKVDRQALINLCDFLKAHPEADMVLNDYLIYYSNSGKQKRISYNVPDHLVLGFNDVHFEPANMHSITYKTAILKDHNIRMDVGVAFTDYECSLFPMQYVSQYCYLSDALYIYTMEREGQSVDPRRYMSTMCDHAFVLEKMINWFDSVHASILGTYFETYASKRIGEMANAHAVRCFRANGNKNSMSEELLRVEQNLKERPCIYRFFNAKSMRLYRFMGYRGYSLISLLVKAKHQIFGDG